MNLNFMYFLDPTRCIRKEERQLATAHFSHHVAIAAAIAIAVAIAIAIAVDIPVP